VSGETWIGPDTAAKNGAFEVFRALAELDPMASGAEVDQHDPGDIPYLRFDPDGQALFDEWRTHLEVEQLRSGRGMPVMESHLAKYRSLMPSLAELSHLVDVVDGATSGPVLLDSARRAAAWCDYLEEHARRIYQAAFEGDVEPAQRLAEKIKSGVPNPFKVWEIVKKGWSGLDTTAAVERAVALLEEHHWVVREEVPPGPAGGAPSTRFHINPKVLGGSP
jgi:hypothetical protein